jgi:two-component system chemotaxis response regulator CheY
MLNILIVDDSSVMRKMLIKMLKLSGLPMGEIREAANGQEGLQILETGNVDLILADIHMPVMDGVEMFERLRQDPDNATLPFIFVSSDSSSTRVKTLLEKGASFVHKPLSPETLLDAVTQFTSPEEGPR